MPKFKLIKDLESNLKKVEETKPTNCFSRWYKEFKIKEITKRITALRLSLKKK